MFPALPNRPTTNHNFRRRAPESPYKAPPKTPPLPKTPKKIPRPETSKKVPEGCELSIQLHSPGNRSAVAGRSHDIMVTQQPGGGASIIVFKGRVAIEEDITFISRRRPGNSFSCCIFVDGVRDLQLSSCCEHRYRIGARLGGPKSRFTLRDLRNAKPCYRCVFEQQIKDGKVSSRFATTLPRTTKSTENLTNTSGTQRPYTSLDFASSHHATQNKRFISQSTDNLRKGLKSQDGRTPVPERPDTSSSSIKSGASDDTQDGRRTRTLNHRQSSKERKSTPPSLYNKQLSDSNNPIQNRSPNTKTAPSSIHPQTPLSDGFTTVTTSNSNRPQPSTTFVIVSPSTTRSNSLASNTTESVAKEATTETMLSPEPEPPIRTSTPTSAESKRRAFSKAASLPGYAPGGGPRNISSAGKPSTKIIPRSPSSSGKKPASSSWSRSRSSSVKSSLDSDINANEVNTTMTSDDTIKSSESSNSSHATCVFDFNNTESPSVTVGTNSPRAQSTPRRGILQRSTTSATTASPKQTVASAVSIETRRRRSVPIVVEKRNITNSNKPTTHQNNPTKTTTTPMTTAAPTTGLSQQKDNKSKPTPEKSVREQILRRSLSKDSVLYSPKTTPAPRRLSSHDAEITNPPIPITSQQERALNSNGDQETKQNEWKADVPSSSDEETDADRNKEIVLQAEVHASPEIPDDIFDT